MKRRLWLKKEVIWFTALLAILQIVTVSVSAAPLKPTAKPIKIGMVVWLTGSAAANGARAKVAAKIAVEEINKAGGIKNMGGVPLEIVFYDSQTNPPKALNASEQAITEGAQVIIYSVMSQELLAAMVANERARIFSLNCASAASEVYQRRFKYVFGTWPAAEVISESTVNLFDWLVKDKGLRVNKIVLVSNGTPYADGIIGGCLEPLKKKGHNVVDMVKYDAAATDLTPTVLKIKGLEADVVMGAGLQSDAALFHRNCYEQGFSPYITGYGTWLLEPKLAELLGPEIMGWMETRLIGTDTQAPGLKVQAYETFFVKFEPRMKVESPGNDPKGKGGAEAYYTVYVLKEMLEIAKSAEADKLREAAFKLRYPRDRVPIATISDLNWDEKGRVHGLTMVGVQWRNKGASRISVWPEDISTGKLELKGVKK